jgi:hypothetical protein
VKKVNESAEIGEKIKNEEDWEKKNGGIPEEVAARRDEGAIGG